MLLVRPCVEHVLALVGRLQVHIMLASGPDLRTSSILAAATSSTILMCLPAAGLRSAGTHCALLSGLLATTLPLRVSLLQKLVHFGRSLQLVLEMHKVPLHGVSRHILHRLLAFGRKLFSMPHRPAGYGGGAVPGRQHSVLPLILLHAHIGIDLPLKAANPALVIMLGLLVRLHPVSAELADLVLPVFLRPM
jgi:hypothetical protein